jgi:hypothetical protein
MAIEGLGRLYNAAPIAAGTLISVKDASAIEFITTGADTFTLASAATYNGTTANLGVITDYFTNTSTSGGAKWVAATQAASATIATASGSTLFYVDCAALPSAALYVSLSAAGSGLVTAVVINLLIQRAPANLRQLSGSSS